MKKFVFRLSPLVRVKKAKEKRQKAELQKAQGVLTALNDELNKLSAQKIKVDQDLNDEFARGIDTRRLAFYSSYFLFLHRESTKKKAEIERAQEHVEQCQQELFKTMNELKVLQKLYDQQLAEYKMEVEKEEEKNINDLVSYRIASS